MSLPLIFAALAVGALMPLQAVVNARLGHAAGKPILASTISFAVGTLALVLVTFVQHGFSARWREVAAGPWWLWTGGLMGAIFVTAALLLVPRLGATTTMATFVAGQLLMSIFLDHFGITGHIRPIDLWRLGGVALLALGMWAIMKAPHAP